MGDEIGARYGLGVRFANATMHNGEGAIAKCGKCDKEAAGGMFGKEGYMTWCEDHVPDTLKGPTAKFVYRAPSNRYPIDKRHKAALKALETGSKLKVSDV